MLSRVTLRSTRATGVVSPSRRPVFSLDKAECNDDVRQRPPGVPHPRHERRLAHAARLRTGLQAEDHCRRARREEQAGQSHPAAADRAGDLFQGAVRARILGRGVPALRRSHRRQRCGRQGRRAVSQLHLCGAAARRLSRPLQVGNRLPAAGDPLLRMTTNEPPVVVARVERRLRRATRDTRSRVALRSTRATNSPPGLRPQSAITIDSTSRTRRWRRNRTSTTILLRRCRPRWGTSMHYVRIFGLVLPLVLAGPTIGAPKEPQTSNDAANGARSADPLNKQYGLKVFDHVLGSAREPAVIMSPYSLTSALDMLALGADGATARLFRQQGITRPHRRGQDTYRSLTSGSNAGPTLRIANSAWLRPHAKPRPRFVKAIRRSYDAGITTLDFSRPDAAGKINAWVNSATQEMIPQVVDSIDPTTQFALINTVYFKGKWVTPFAKADTKESPFTRLDGTKHNVPMMNATRSVSYAERPNWHAIALPYGGERFQMVVATSKEPTKAAEFKQEAAKSEFLQALGQLKMQ